MTSTTRLTTTATTYTDALLGSFLANDLPQVLAFGRRVLSYILTPVTKVIEVSRSYTQQSSVVLTHRDAMTATQAHPIPYAPKAYEETTYPLAIPVEVPAVATPTEAIDAPKAAKKATAAPKARVTKKTPATSPYSAMTYRELQATCKARALRAVGTKGELFARLTQDDKGTVKVAANKGR